MALFQLILDGLRQRGGAALWTWIGLMLATWLAFSYGLDRSMSGRALVGAGFIYGMAVLGGSALLAKLRTPGAPERKKPAPRKQQRRGG